MTAQFIELRQPGEEEPSAHLQVRHLVWLIEEPDHSSGEPATAVFTTESDTPVYVRETPAEIRALIRAAEQPAPMRSDQHSETVYRAPDGRLMEPTMLVPTGLFARLHTQLLELSELWGRVHRWRKYGSAHKTEVDEQLKRLADLYPECRL